MKNPLPPSISGLLNGTATPPPPVVPTIPLAIPTTPEDARAARRADRQAERLARRNRQAVARGLDFDLPF